MSRWVPDPSDLELRRPLRPGQRRCRQCGAAYWPRPRQRLPLCPLHRERHAQRQAYLRLKAWRRRQRALGELYVELEGRKRSG